MSFEDMQDTILHEIAHALVPHECHGEIWKQKAKKIGACGERTKQLPPISKTYYKWSAMCPNCLKVIHRHRKIKISCGFCDTRFNPNYLFIWEKL